MSELNGLNDWLAAELYGYMPPSWWSAEVFTGQGNWSQAEYNSIVRYSHPAPQIATSYMAQLANSYEATYGDPTLVTWSTSCPNAAYDSEAESVNAVNGQPFALVFGKVAHLYSNKFCPGSCL